jgi:hypothetical protein
VTQRRWDAVPKPSLHRSSSRDPIQGVGSQVIKDISKISDLPLETIEEYRQYGWTDEEIVENLNDAINFLNSNLHSNELAQSEIPPRSIFLDQCRSRSTAQRGRMLKDRTPLPLFN